MKWSEPVQVGQLEAMLGSPGCGIACGGDIWEECMQDLINDICLCE